MSSTERMRRAEGLLEAARWAREQPESGMGPMASLVREAYDRFELALREASTDTLWDALLLLESEPHTPAMDLADHLNLP